MTKIIKDHAGIDIAETVPGCATGTAVRHGIAAGRQNGDGQRPTG